MTAKQLPSPTIQVQRPRPLLDQIDTDLTHKIEQYNRLGREIAELEGFRAVMRRHEEFDALVSYFKEKK